MSYTQSVLQPGERIILMGRLHWITYWPSMLIVVLGVALVALLLQFGARGATVAWAAFALAVLFALMFAYAWFTRWITEFAITDRRVISKRGFIMRNTAEMNMDKVESVKVDQSVLGRLLDYGTVTVVGTGQGLEPIRDVASPIAFRNAITAK
ncbi:MAG: PH domain-containing protein [Xanthobacteraceae bacterium]|nr:PH domain-containing protein [Xanthobacteraceae bacterium]